MLSAHASRFSPQFQDALQGAARNLPSSGLASSQQLAVGQVYGAIVRHSAMLAYLDNFWILAVSILIIIPLVFLMKRPPKGTVASAH